MIALSLPAIVALQVAPARAQNRGAGGGAGGGQIPPPSSGGLSSIPIGPGVVPKVMRYPLGPQDVISITVERPENYSVPEVVVPPDGKISLPFFGTFYVTGKTTRQLEVLLTRSIAGRVRSPKVSVSLKRLRNAAAGYVRIIGSVKAPGEIEILETYRISEVVAKVGGVLGRLDEVEATLSRNNKTIPLNLYEAVSHPRSTANVAVKADDFILVRERDPGLISINGDVMRPGIFQMRRAPRPANYEVPLKAHLQDAIIAAGGFNGAYAPNTGRVVGYIQRGDQKIDLRVQDAVDLKDNSVRDTSANIALRPNDYITLKVEQPIPISVFGFVRSPNNYLMAPGSTVLQAINQASGWSRNPEEIVATLQRGATKIPIDLRALVSGDSRANPTLQAGDIVNLGEPDVIKVDISGKVKNPSEDKPLRLKPNSTLLNALAQAGDITAKPQNTRISILRQMPDGSQRYLNIDAVGLLERQDPSQNARLADGDLITVSEARDKSIIVSGEVLKPGLIEWREGQGLSEVIAKAGGPNANALLSRISIERDGKRIETDAYDAVTNGIPSNFVLQENDTITVPENFNRIVVTEAVNRPGYVFLPERRTLSVLEAISEAGGARSDARTQEVALLRKTGAGPNDYKTLILPLNQLGKGKGLSAASVPVESGDVIVVPKGKVTQSGLSSALSVLSVANIFRSFAR